MDEAQVYSQPGFADPERVRQRVNLYKIRHAPSAVAPLLGHKPPVAELKGRTRERPLHIELANSLREADYCINFRSLGACRYPPDS